MLRKIVLSAVLLYSLTAFGTELLKIPYRPDPPITIDGQMNEWNIVPFEIILKKKENVIYKVKEWDSADDLSAIIRMAWRPEGLYVAAQVTDDVFVNKGPGNDIFLGDHLMLFIDTKPQGSKDRDNFSKGQFQIAISPGNLLDERETESFGRIDPEVYEYFPKNKSITSATVAARKTYAGYNIEALIPWEVLAIKKPQKGMWLKLELNVADTDKPSSRQDSMMAISSAEWKLRKRSRLLNAVLADSTGEGNIRKGVVKLPNKIDILNQEAIVKPSTKLTKNFDLKEEWLEDTAVTLFIRARLHTPSRHLKTGDTYALVVSVNGKLVKGEKMVKKQIDMRTVSGDMATIYCYKGFRLPYAFSFSDATRTNRYAAQDIKQKIRRGDYLLDISEFVKPGKNTVVVYNNHSLTSPMHLGLMNVSFMPPITKKQRVLVKAKEYISPRTDKELVKLEKLGNAQISVETGSSKFLVKSEFSIPGGKWVTGSNNFFTHKRSVKRQDTVIVVEDVFTNNTNDNLGIMQKHEVTSNDPESILYLNGLVRPKGLKGYYTGAGNWTSYINTPKGGIGILPQNDVFRVHAQHYIADKNTVGICDLNLVIPPNASYTAKWLIGTSQKGNYFDFINNLRVFLGSNFKIVGPLTFIRAYNPITTDWSVDKLRKFFKLKGTRFAATGMMYRTEYEGKKLDYLFNHGMALAYSIDQVKKAFKFFHEADKNLKIMLYYHCFIDAGDYSCKTFKGCEIKTSDGKHLTYGKYYYPLFYPTLENKFGKESEKIIELLMNKLPIEGIYWDEFAYSMGYYTYHSLWDKHSGDIDLKTHKIKQLKSSVTLITYKWRLAMVKKILKRKPYMFANGPIICESLRKFGIPTFTESAQKTFAARTQLYTPIVLGDHFTTLTLKDSYNGILNALDYGCLYYWYSDKVYPTYETIVSKMYPITPIRLGKGYILGKERIVTRKSGYYGWNDNSEHEVYYYDHEGHPLGRQKVKTKIVNGKKFSEINLWSDWSAVIVRK